VVKEKSRKTSSWELACFQGGMWSDRLFYPQDGQIHGRRGWSP